MKKYYYCQSYQAFNLALSDDERDKVVIVTSVDNIVNTCNKLGVNYICHPAFSVTDFWSKKKEIDFELNKLVRVIGESEFHFSHTQFAVFLFALIIRILQVAPKIVLHDFEFKYSPLKLKDCFTFKAVVYWAHLFLLRFVYKIPMELRMSTSDQIVLSLKEELISDRLIKINESDTFYQKTIKVFNDIEFSVEEINYLYVVQNHSADIYNEEKIVEIHTVFKDLGFVIKMHPKIFELNPFSNCRVLDESVPVEFYFKKVKKSVVSISSASLITASMYPKIQAISLLDIVATDDSFIKGVKKYLEKESNGKILFPKSIEELISMLNGV